jgi:hypothetical protein
VVEPEVEEALDSRRTETPEDHLLIIIGSSTPPISLRRPLLAPLVNEARRDLNSNSPNSPSQHLVLLVEPTLEASSPRRLPHRRRPQIPALSVRLLLPLLHTEIDRLARVVVKGAEENGEGEEVRTAE